MATSKLITTNLFDDGTTIKFSVFPYATAADAIGYSKDHIMTFNENYTDLMTDCIVAPTGSKFKRISAAEIETTQQTLVYAKNESFAKLALNREENEGNE